MSKTLLIVESPAKAKTIEKYLGKNYKVLASMGHLRDLPKSQFGVDVENNFTPKYINIRGKGDLIKSLKNSAKSADRILLATDPDREGEAIAWHLAHILGLNLDDKIRIVFNEITKNAVQEAVKKPRPLALPVVDAQQGRRLLDRIVGYKLSPLLWKKIKWGLSAGRVQSVAVRLICDREAEIEAFISEEYWTIGAKLSKEAKSAQFDGNVATYLKKKLEIASEEEVLKHKAALEASKAHVKSVERKDRKRSPQPPFTTSTLQQDASRKLGFNARRTMQIAQQLYEGLEIGPKGTTGLITYMRTDSTRVADSAAQEARSFIEGRFGKEYLPAKPPVYSSKKSAQDAHEAIRPSEANLNPEAIKSFLSNDQFKVYNLIWRRFMASQMQAALYNQLTVVTEAGDYGIRSTATQLVFPGFTAIYEEGKDEVKEKEQTTLPDLKVGEVIQLREILPEQHFTQPPPRYNEATLIKLLEEKGIGRPSTYAPIIETILDRKYVEREQKQFHPTELGKIVVDLLKQYFHEVVDVGFTASMEQKLDEIEEHHLPFQKVLAEFYGPFEASLLKAEEEIGEIDMKDEPEVTEIPCEKCGSMMVIKQGRFGSFLACPNYPECKTTKPIVKETGVACPTCKDGMIIERRSKKGKRFWGCNRYPECTFVSWDEPILKNCETCGSFMVKRFGKEVCGNLECPTRVTKASAAKKAAAAGESTVKTKSKTTTTKKAKAPATKVAKSKAKTATAKTAKTTTKKVAVKKSPGKSEAK